MLDDAPTWNKVPNVTVEIIAFIDDILAQEVVSVTCMTNCWKDSWCLPLLGLLHPAEADPEPIYSRAGPGGALVVVRPAPCHSPGDYRDLA